MTDQTSGPHGPYETEQDARTGAAELLAAIERATRPGPMTDATRAARRAARVDYLEGAITAAGVETGAYDQRITTWLADMWEPETLAVVVGLLERAHAAGRATVETCPECLTRAAVNYVWTERQADGIDGDSDTPTLLDAEICTAADDLAHMGATVDAVGLLAWSRMHVDQRRAALPALLRCYVHHAAAETALRALPRDDGADTTPALHWPAPGLSTTTLCQGEPLTSADFTRIEADVTCPECRAHLGHAVDAEADTAEAESKPEDWLTWTLYRPGKDGPDDALKTGVRKRSATDPADLAREKLEQHAPGRPDWFVNVYGLGEAGPGVLAWAEWKGTHGTVRTSADVDSDTETEA